MSVSRALDANNDIFLSGNRIAIVRDGDQVVQNVRSRLLMYLGEWFLDKSEGTPWYEEVFVKPVNLGVIESVIKQRIASTPGLERITEFALDFANGSERKLLISFSAQTEFGGVTLEEITFNG